MNQKPAFMNRTLSEWLSSLPVFMLLLLTLIIGTGEMIHGQLLRIGERSFGNPDTGIQYFLLRADPTKPECDPNQDVDAAIAAQASAGPVSDIDALFADEVVDPAAQRQSLLKAKELCQEKHAMYDNIVQNITPELKMYRAVETSFFGVFRFGTENRALLLLIMVAIASVTTTVGLHHISLRPPKSQVDFRVYSIAMTAANALLVFSSVYYLHLQQNSGIPIDKPYINWIWIGLFSVLTLISLKSLVMPPKDAPAGGSFGLALLSIPLYAVLAIISALNFIAQGHYAGVAIYLGQMMELSGIFLNLALFIWAGMILKQTRIVDLFMDIIRPWKFSPEMLTWVLLLAAALPTAYTGASGIFVIAAGAVIYREVMNSGGRRQYALAATAMSGSLGVVLKPCLLVVVIAALNKQVTTAELYNWGIVVFFISSTIFLIASQMLRTQKIQIQSPSVALPQSARALVPVAPYIVIGGAVILFYGAETWGLNTKMDEFTAPVILPIILLAILVFDKIRRVPLKEHETPEEVEENRRFNLEQSVRTATNDTIGHIGALIMLMALSVSMGGVIERSGIMEAFPHSFDSIWVALTLLMVLLIGIGMIMDPFGAVILVSATIAPVAYNNGVHPVHFWMMVLTAFELGYLSPPVALNQLLARQVVGEKEMEMADEEVKHMSFYYRYERWILPVVVMSIALLLVTYGGQWVVVEHGEQIREAWRGFLNAII